jgi:hypothetical protein
MRHASLVVLALFLTAALAQAQEAPKRKSGLWELKRTSSLSRDEMRVFQVCVDQASDDALRQLGEGMRGECKSDKVQRTSDKIVVDSVCTFGNVNVKTAKTHAVVTGNFDSAYKIEGKSTFDPPIQGKSESTSLVEAKWTGACKPDMKPGDMILPNGTKFNPDSPREVKGDKLWKSKGASSDKTGKGKQQSIDTIIDKSSK